MKNPWEINFPTDFRTDIFPSELAPLETFPTEYFSVGKTTEFPTEKIRGKFSDGKFRWKNHIIIIFYAIFPRKNPWENKIIRRKFTHGFFRGKNHIIIIFNSIFPRKNPSDNFPRIFFVGKQ